MDAPVRMVLDTNVVLDLTVFADPGTTGLRLALDSGAVRALATDATLKEFRSVLGYARLGFDEQARDEALAWYEQRVALVEQPEPSACPLRCRKDPDDQKFLDLAWGCGARWLVSKDLALLRLARASARHGRFDIVAPAGLPPLT